MLLQVIGHWSHQSVMATNEDHKTTDATHSQEDIALAIEKLKGRDRFGKFGQWATTLSGAAAGGATAGSIAAAAGATTLLGSTTLASALGGVFVVATPVGWVVGSAVAGGALAYGVTRLVKSGARNDRIREEVVERLSTRLEEMKKRAALKPDSFELLQACMAEAVRRGLISDEVVSRTLNVVESGKLDVNVAIKRITDLCESL